MKEINKQHDQLSGHIRIIAVPLNNIKSIQGSKIEYYNPELNYELKCSRESISYSCPTKTSNAGISIEHKISATISGRSTQIDQFLEELLHYQFVVILQNSEGNFIRIGDHLKGLTFSFEYSNYPDPNSSFGYHISFSGETLIGQRAVSNF